MTISRKVYHKAYYLDNKEHIAEVQRAYYLDNKDTINGKARSQRRVSPEIQMYRSAKLRAKKAKREFNIEKSDITIPSICPILGVPIKVGTRYGPSLDRIDPTRGYVKGNVWVVSRKANMMKQDATKSELVAFAKWINKENG